MDARGRKKRGIQRKNEGRREGDRDGGKRRELRREDRKERRMEEYTITKILLRRTCTKWDQ